MMGNTPGKLVNTQPNLHIQNVAENAIVHFVNQFLQDYEAFRTNFGRIGLERRYAILDRILDGIHLQSSGEFRSKFELLVKLLHVDGLDDLQRNQISNGFIQLINELENRLGSNPRISLSLLVSIVGLDPLNEMQRERILDACILKTNESHTFFSRSANVWSKDFVMVDLINNLNNEQLLRLFNQFNGPTKPQFESLADVAKKLTAMTEIPEHKKSKYADVIRRAETCIKLLNEKSQLEETPRSTPAPAPK